MPGRFVGHRGARDSEWSWERNEETTEGRLSERPLRAVLMGTAFIIGVAAFAFGLVLLLNNGDGNAAPPIVSATSTPTPDATPNITPEPPTPSGTPAPTRTTAPTRTPSPTASPVPTASPTPGPTYDAILSSWSPTESLWITPTHNSSTSNYAQGGSVPFLLQIDDVQPGTRYDLTITYDCQTARGHAFDYLTGLASGDTEPLLTAPGPGTTVPDSALITPDDPSITFDDGQGGAFRAWGAVFSSASAPTPSTACTRAKTVNLSLLAQDTTLRLVWAAHLASIADWGAGQGAGSATPFGITVDVNGEVQIDFTMAAGSIN